MIGAVAALHIAGTVLGAQHVAQVPLGPWWSRTAEVRVGHYWIRTDLPAERANALARHFNTMYDEFSRRLASLPARAPAPMKVLLFENSIDYLETLRFKYGIDATGTGGMFFVKPSGTALALWVGDLPTRRIEHVIQHEGFHQFAWSRFGGDLPLWVNEGLAEFFGNAVVVGRSVVIGQASARVVQDVKGLIERDATVEFSKMLAMSSEQWFDAVRDGRAAALYHQAWSMVQFLIYGDGGRYATAFERYLKLINRGVLSQDAFVRAFETDDIDAFENRWRQYAASARPSGFLTALERMEFLAEGARELARRGAVVGSLDELREALAAIPFSYSYGRHDLAVDLRPGREMYRIPWSGNDEFEQRPVFVVRRPKLYQMPRRERPLEDASPTPPSIRTEFLDPRDIEVRWTRDPDTNTFRYEIEIRSRAR